MFAFCVGFVFEVVIISIDFETSTFFCIFLHFF
jgi:hypothetical protein